MKNIIAFFCFIYPIVSFSQTFYKEFGNPTINEGGQVIIPSSDGNFIVGGYKGDSALLIKINPSGTLLWSLTFKPDIGSNIYQLDNTTDGYIIGTGNATSSSGKRSGFYFKVDLSGVIQWVKIVNDSRNIICQQIQSKMTSEYLLFCNISDITTSSFTDPILIRINALNGNIISTSPRYNFISTLSYIDEIYSVAKGIGNSYYATGRSYVQGSATPGMRPTLTKFNNLGNLQSSKYLLYSSTANARIYGIDINYANDSLLIGYFGDKITGTTGNYSVGLIKTDTFASVIWSKDYNINSTINEYSFKALVTNYGYAIVGYTLGSSNKNFFIIAVNKIGNLLWAKSFGTSAEEDLLNTTTPMACTDGNNIYLTGRTGTLNGNKDLVVAKVDNLGNTNCNTGVNLTITVSSNPINSFVCPVSNLSDNLIFQPSNNSIQNSVIEPCSNNQLNLGNDTSTCDSLLLNATVPNATSYLWSTGATQPSIYVSTADTFWVEASINCCIVRDTIVITKSLSGTVNLTGDTIICSGQSATLVASGGISYLWNNGALDSSITVQPLVTTTYSVASVNGGCFSPTDSIKIIVNPRPLVSLTGDTLTCIGDSVQLIATSIGAINYFWSSPIISTLDSVWVTPSSSTTYYVSTSNGVCASFQDSIKVNLLSAPIASFAIANPYCLNTSINFNNTSIGSANYLWNFGDSASGILNTSNLNNPSHTFNSISSFTITLSTQNNCGSSSISQPIVIQSGPPASVLDSVSICLGQQTTLIASGGSTFQWSGASSDTISTINVSPTVTSMYIVKASNGICFGIADTAIVHVLPLPTVQIIGDTIACNGVPVQLIASSTGANSFSWSNPILSNNDTLFVNPILPTTYSVYSTNTFCNSLPDSIKVSPLLSPIPVFNYVGIPCIGSAINFTNNSTSNATFSWNFGDPSSGILNTSALFNASHTFGSDTTFNVVLTAQNFCGINSLNQPIIIQKGPKVILPNDTTICKGQSVNLVANGGVSYQWSGASTSTNATILVSPIIPSTYFVTASNGTCFGDQDTVIVTPIDKPIISIIGNDTVCSGTTVLLTALGANSYLWSGDINATTSTITVMPLVPETYILIGETDGCKSEPDTFNIKISNESVANFSYQLDSCSGDFSFLNLSTSANSYRWIFGDGIQSNIMHPMHSYSEPGEFEISLITNPGYTCSDTLITSIKVDPTNQGYIFTPNAFTPNGDGINDEFIITTPNNCKYLELFIYNRWGELIYQTQGYRVIWNGNSKSNPVNEGVYVFLVKTGGVEKFGHVTLLH